MPPRRLSNSKSQINFLPKAPQRRGSTSSVQRNNSLAAAYRPSRSTTPPKAEHIQEIEERKEGPSGLAYFSLWKGVEALWRGIDWCVGRMISGWKGF
ncbi:hypothetical protein yc1106_08219 [Curvularia clavata]|uniref:Uncharacterized protein n=1 Tax=Curvularia clavata TaxID=95742 RepID=A0A9Q8ZFU8_CURCL|nr:hypothetical protein yc1106_08219 [Curvularia clavata]